jgi:hypothetical protein
MIEVICNIVVLALLTRILWKQQKTLDTIQRETKDKFEIIYYMLCDVLGERQNKKIKGD